MDEAMIRTRCEEWVSAQELMGYDFVGHGGWEHTDALVELVKTAYADGQRVGIEREVSEIQALLGCHRGYIQESIRDLQAKTEDIPNIDRVRQTEQQLANAQATIGRLRAYASPSDLEDARQQADGSTSLAAKQAYINGLKHHLVQAEQQVAQLREAAKRLLAIRSQNDNGVAVWATEWDDLEQALRETGA